MWHYAVLHLYLYKFSTKSSEQFQRINGRINVERITEPVLHWLNHYFKPFINSVKEKRTTALDVGEKFDRLIISENETPISFIDKSLFSNFRRRGKSNHLIKTS